MQAPRTLCAPDAVVAGCWFRKRTGSCGRQTMLLGLAVQAFSAIERGPLPKRRAWAAGFLELVGLKIIRQKLWWGHDDGSWLDRSVCHELIKSRQQLGSGRIE
jgi:hypothetical protein